MIDVYSERIYYICKHNYINGSDTRLKIIHFYLDIIENYRLLNLSEYSFLHKHHTYLFWSSGIITLKWPSHCVGFSNVICAHFTAHTSIINLSYKLLEFLMIIYNKIYIQTNYLCCTKLFDDISRNAIHVFQYHSNIYFHRCKYGMCKASKPAGWHSCLTPLSAENGWSHMSMNHQDYMTLAH